MGGSATFDEWDYFPSPSSEVRTLVLVGRTGNGKSATANSILRKRVFESMSSSAGVTTTCELHNTVLEDGRILNVIDTPGLFDSCVEPEFIVREIVKCISMAKGIHAVLVVLSARSRVSQEEEAAIESLRKLFGPKISDYMIVVFTGGDDLEDNKQTLEQYLGRCPDSLKGTLRMCGNRRVLFDNKTKDELKRYEQVKELISIVDDVVDKNDGKAFTDDLFVELKEEAMKLLDKKSESNEQLRKLYEEQLKNITEMIESKLRETNEKLQQQLDEEKAARLQAEASAQAAQIKSNDEMLQQLNEEKVARLRAEASAQAAQIQQQLNEEKAARLQAEASAQAAQIKSNAEMRSLRQNLERAQRETGELRKQAESRGCSIL